MSLQAPETKQSQLVEIQCSAVAFANHIKEMTATPKPSEVHEVCTVADQISKMAIEELDFLLDASVNLQQTPRDLRKITALYLLAATPLLFAGIVAFALLTSWRFHSGAARAVMEASVTSLLLSVVFTTGAEYRKRQKASTCKDTIDAGEEQQSTLQDYAKIVKGEAEKYEDALLRKQICDKPWLTALALIVLELAVCTAISQFLLFVATFTACAMAVYGGSAMAIYTSPRPMPENMTEVEKFIARQARAPILVYFAGILGIHAMPLVEAAVEPDTLLIGLANRLQATQENLAKAEEVRQDASRKFSQNAQFASYVEKVFTGTSSERVASLNGLSRSTGEVSGAIAEKASQLLGAEKGSSAAVREHAARVGDMLGSVAGLAASVAPLENQHGRGRVSVSDENVRQLAQGVSQAWALFGKK